MTIELDAPLQGWEPLAIATRPEVHGLSIETVPTYKLLAATRVVQTFTKEKSGIPILLQLENLQQLLTSTERGTVSPM